MDRITAIVMGLAGTASTAVGAWLTTWLANKGLEWDSTAMTGFLMSIFSVLWFAIVSWVGERLPAPILTLLRFGAPLPSYDEAP